MKLKNCSNRCHLFHHRSTLFRRHSSSPAAVFSHRSWLGCCSSRYRFRMAGHISPVFWQLHWLPVHQSVMFKLATLIHRSLTGTAPAYLNSSVGVCSLHLPRHKQITALLSSEVVHNTWTVYYYWSKLVLYKDWPKFGFSVECFWFGRSSEINFSFRSPVEYLFYNITPVTA